MDKTQICNLASMLYSDGTIAGFQEDSKRAAACRLVWNICRDMALSYHDWNFARRNESLALSNEEIDKYKYVYVYPADCLAVRKVYDTQGKEYQFGHRQEKRIYDIFVSKNKSEKLIVTDMKLAKVQYTAVIDNTELWPAAFCEAVAALIASKLVKGETGASSSENLFKNYINLIDLAKSLDVEEIIKAIPFNRPKSSFLPWR